MHVLHSREAFPGRLGPSIFLAGPTPRSTEIPSWRTVTTEKQFCALDILRDKNINDLTVIVPEDRDSTWNEEFLYEKQLDWETEGLSRATCILFWVPRNHETLPGYTTNIEFGEWKDSGKIVLGWPMEASKMKPFAYWAKRFGIPTAHTLEETIDLALTFLKGRHDS